MYDGKWNNLVSILSAVWRIECTPMCVCDGGAGMLAERLVPGKREWWLGFRWLAVMMRNGEGCILKVSAKMC